MLEKANNAGNFHGRAAVRLCAALLLQLLLALPAAAQSEEDGLAPALEYLDSAISLYNSGDAQNARRSVEAGLLYSEIPADLFYLKAVLLSDADSPRGDVLEAAFEAFNGEKRWFRFEAEPAAVLAASLLAETGRYSDALSLLDRFAAEVSADTAFIRCKIAYLQRNVTQARNAVHAALRLWPSDARFPLLFFQFEAFHRLDAKAWGRANVRELSGDAGKLAFEIASWIVRAWNILGSPDAPIEISLAAVPFLRQASPLDAARVIRRLWNMDGFNALSPQTAPFLALEALRENIASADEALSAFFGLGESASGIPLDAVELLGAIAVNAAGQETRSEIESRLSSFTGLISADANGDFIADSLLSYRLGRPHSAVYDTNQDGYPDITAECGFGEPLSILFPQLNAAIDYQAYPYAASVRVADTAFVLRSGSFSCAPLSANNLRSKFLAPNFFYLMADSSFNLPKEKELAADAVLKIENDTVTALNGAHLALRRETFYDEKGSPASQREIINGAVVARTIFAGGKSSECRMDNDGDGYFETRIVYGAKGEETLLVDTDGDMIFDYSETRGADGSARQAWTEPGGASPAVQWIMAADGTSSAVWLHPESGEEVTARFDALASLGAGGSFSVSYMGETRKASFDAETGLWLLDGRTPPASADVAAAASQLKQSGLAVVFSDVGFEGGYVRVLKIGGYLFAETVYARQAAGG